MRRNCFGGERTCLGPFSGMNELGFAGGVRLRSIRPTGGGVQGAAAVSQLHWPVQWSGTTSCSGAESTWSIVGIGCLSMKLIRHQKAAHFPFLRCAGGQEA